MFLAEVRQDAVLYHQAFHLVAADRDEEAAVLDLVGGTELEDSLVPPEVPVDGRALGDAQPDGLGLAVDQEGQVAVFVGVAVAGLRLHGDLVP